MLNLFKLLPLIVAFSLVTGCGGSGGTNDVEDFAPTPQAPDFQSISGTVQGLTGILTIGWDNRTQVISTDSINVPLAFEAGTDINLQIINQPTSQTCTIDTPTQFPNQNDDIAGVSISCITQNIIRVSVVNFLSGQPLPNINVSATWNEQGTQETLTGVSDGQGLASFLVPTFDGRIMVNADPDGFGEQSKVVQNTAVPAGRVARMLMQPVIVGTTFDNAAGANLTMAGDSLVSLPANSLVDANGDLYIGTVTAEMTQVDPGLDAELMPGDYLSQGPGGAIAPIESYGALSVTFTGANGEVLDLDTGVVADINIPISDAARQGAPTVSPLFHYDPITGYWTEEGTGSLSDFASGLSVYSAQVSHFTTWNADEAYVPVMLSGCVVNATGTPFANVRIDATGATYLGTSRAISDSNGMFSIPVRANSTVFVTAGDGLQSNTLQVAVDSVDESESECLIASAGSSTINLTWGENPRDLDTRLHGFSSDDSNDDFQVYYANRTVTVNNLTILLDVDDTSSFGPEITTFPEFPFPGVYRYTVHLFSGSGSIQASPARVELNLRGQISVFNPPEGTPTECWAVFDLEVDATGNVIVSPLDSWEEESYCTNADFPNPTQSGVPGPLAGSPIEQPGISLAPANTPDSTDQITQPLPA